jgi:hypothetical protein
MPGAKPGISPVDVDKRLIVVVMVAMVVAIASRIRRQCRPGKNCHSQKNKHPIAKFHLNLLVRRRLSLRTASTT